MLKFTKDTKIGCINNEGTIIIPPIYHKIGPFSEGLAAVSIYDVKNPNFEGRNGISGYINCQGKVVIPLKFLVAEPYLDRFSEGLAVFKSNDKSSDKYGYINKTGEIEIAPLFTQAYPFHDGVAVVKLAPDDYAVIDKKGTILFHFLELCKKEINPSVKKIFLNRFGYREGLISVSPIIGEKRDSPAVFDTKGNLVFKSNFASILPYKNGMARVADTKGNWGWIDKKGKVVIPLKFKYTDPFHDGVSVVSTHTKKAGIINEKGEYVVEPIYSLIFSKNAGLFEARAKVGERVKSGLIDKNGQVIIDFEYDHIATFSDGVAFATKGAVTKCINQSGDVLFESNTIFWDSNEGVFINGLARVFYNGKKEFINKQGKIVPIKYAN